MRYHLYHICDHVYKFLLTFLLTPKFVNSHPTTCTNRAALLAKQSTAYARCQQYHCHYGFETQLITIMLSLARPVNHEPAAIATAIERLAIEDSSSIDTGGY